MFELLSVMLFCEKLSIPFAPACRQAGLCAFARKIGVKKSVEEKSIIRMRLNYCKPIVQASPFARLRDLSKGEGIKFGIKHRNLCAEKNWRKEICRREKHYSNAIKLLQAYCSSLSLALSKGEGIK